MNLQRPDLNPKPSCSKSGSVWRGGALNVTSAHVVTQLIQDAAIIGSTVSKVAFLKPYSQPLVLPSKSDHNCHVHGKLNSLN